MTDRTVREFLIQSVTYNQQLLSVSLFFATFPYKRTKWDLLWQLIYLLADYQRQTIDSQEPLILLKESLQKIRYK
ncbi:hypothetical protein P9166_14055 [Lactococcus lactis]|nr:hypothetical protein P9166_14055 [Lactococcus lactis]